jgi:molecular chaperone DnaK (HSP70)
MLRNKINVKTIIIFYLKKAAYGAQQREAIKNSVNEGADRDDIKILTRPVAAAVILNNQRNYDKLVNSMEESSDYLKVVFDITEASLDASVIRIKDSKDFQVISNVGDSSFGVHDIDERIVEHIINEKASRRSKNASSRSDSPHNVETVNAYSSLVKSIKQHVAENGVVSVDLTNLNENEFDSKNTRKKSISSQDELVINKNLISRVLCKDIYDWSLAHIEKAINQADVRDKDVDEIIIIGTENKMPGFYEYLKNVYPNKQISFVPDGDLAVGAAIVVSFIFNLSLFLI